MFEPARTQVWTRARWFVKLSPEAPATATVRNRVGGLAFMSGAYDDASL